MTTVPQSLLRDVVGRPRVEHVRPNSQARLEPPDVKVRHLSIADLGLVAQGYPRYPLRCADSIFSH